MSSPRRLVAFALLAACRPDTTRPAITPYPEAAGIEVRLRPQEATHRLAEALKNFVAEAGLPNCDASLSV